MKKPSRFLRMLLASGLLISLLAVTVAPAAAQPFPDPPNFPWEYEFQDPPLAFSGTPFNTIFYPWVSNGEDFGLGESVTSISVQNLEAQDGQIWIYRGTGNNTWTLGATATLSAWASKTFTAAQLGIPEGDGAPVAVVGYQWDVVPAELAPWAFASPYDPDTYNETVVILSNPLDGAEGQAQVFACVANNEAGNPSPFRWMSDDEPDVDGVSYWTGQDGNRYVQWSNQNQLQALLDAVNEDADQLINPFGGLNADGDCGDSVVVDGNSVTYFADLTIGGTSFATATASEDDSELEQFVTTHTATSGYNAINGYEVLQYDDWYLPIVQTNGGPGGTWNSIIRVANLADQNSAVTVRFFPADDGSGSLQTGFQLQNFVSGGETWNINLGELVPDGWVGSAHIYTDGYVFAMVDRYKAGYNMWISNTGSNANFEWEAQLGAPFLAPLSTYVLYAPHVLLDWFGWNTGINVANLVEWDNNVSIQYYNTFGNAVQGQSKRLAAHGMTYFYDPSDAGQNWSAQDPATDVNAGVVAAALIWSEFPVAAVIDATKYPETDPRMGADVFQATSYSATQNLHMWQAFPYVTKGNPTDGSGATSGINMFNPNAVARTVDVYWVNPSGFGASNFGVSTISIPAFASGFVYTLTQHNLPNGFMGSAVVISRGFDFLPIVAASANVNYDVDGDGAVIYNGFNPCGYSRTNGLWGDLEIGDSTFPWYFLCIEMPIPGGQAVTDF